MDTFSFLFFFDRDYVSRSAIVDHPRRSCNTREGSQESEILMLMKLREYI